MVSDVIYGYSVEIEQSGQDFYVHKTGFSEKTLKKAVLDAGFPYAVKVPSHQWELLIYGFKDYNTHFLHEMLKLKLRNE